MGLFAVSFNDLLLPAALGLLTFFLLRKSVRRFADLRNRRQQRSPQRPQLRIAPEPSLPGPLSVAGSVSGEVELHERARELMARIDSKTAALEHLLRHAALQTERLEQAIRRAESLADKEPPKGS